MELPNKKYQIVYADPPWKYEKLNFYEKKGVNKEVYPRMELEDIIKLPIKEIVEDNSILFLWTTTPFIKKALRVMEEWGFEYCTIVFVWVKTYDDGKIITGMGRYTRNSIEMVLLGKRGVGVKRIGTNVNQTVFAPIENHSKKPDIIRKKIVELLGDVPRIELFARQKTEGWDVWGNQV